ncbi:MAG: DEAD/DEAH box helicase family protein, partial [Nitriliruptoraceae bacterium]
MGARVLVVGGGGREHALVAALVADPVVDAVVAAPGNPGIAALARCAPVRIDDVDGLVALAVAERVDLVVVGPEAPLVAGLVDALAARDVPAFGPSAEAARLEGSKTYAKAVMDAAGVPTAPWTATSDPAEALAALRATRAKGYGAGLVVLATGLGKTFLAAFDSATAARVLFVAHREE